MVFSSLIFLFMFLVFTLTGYYILPRVARNTFLLIVSLFFYAWGEPSYVIVMIISIVLNYTAGRLIAHYKSREKIVGAKITVAVLSVIDIGLLVFFKYTGFIFDNISSLFKISFPFDPFIDSIVLPIGISFYTFQMMSYVIDVYRGDTAVQKNILDFGCYVSLFPQLIAGPIVQYKTVADQMKNRRENLTTFAEGVIRFVVGLGKKVLLANGVGIIWDTVAGYDLATLPTLTALIGSVAFSFQIYFDFSGYSDMAIGLGKMLGFEFLENFNYPYISKSVTDFWRRWHISLSSWFRDYVYIPLGGNRRGFAKQIRNIAIVWLCTGIWHGASWNFVLWGAWFGILLIAEKLFLLKALERLPRFVSHIWALFCAWFGWVIFANEDLSRLGQYIKALFGGSGVFADGQSLWLLSNYAILFVIAAIASTPLCKNLWKKVENCSFAPVLRVLFVVAILVLCTAYVVSSTYNPFIYFRF
ncbi:MAG: MBOAT family protein [Clostridia bacterium]|nr:MBOAT family protein [Clostridia bacterium]